MSCSYTFKPEEHPDSNMDASWECPHDSHEESDRCIFHMKADERSSLEVTSDEIHGKIEENLDLKDPRLNEYIGVNLPELSFGHDVLNGVTNTEINFQYATIGRVHFSETKIEQAINFSHAEIQGRFDAGDMFVQGSFVARNAVFNGEIEASESKFIDEADFSGAVFTEDVFFDEAEFMNENFFCGARFKSSANFRACTSHGKSHELSDNTDFSGAVFEGPALFGQSELDYLDLTGCVFEDDADFSGVVFDGVTKAYEVRFKQDVDFSATRFFRHAWFDNSVFEAGANFEDASFSGRNDIGEADAVFEGVDFQNGVYFTDAHFKFADFSEAEFEGIAHFEETEFHSDAEYQNAVFNSEADFDEVRFYEDVKFNEAQFNSKAVFRGGQFEGESLHLEDNATFEKAVFTEGADFTDTKFTSANFMNVETGSDLDFEDSEFTDRIDFLVVPESHSVFVDFTEAVIDEGEIIQSATGEVPYDMTKAVIGDLDFSGETNDYELLDYFRFCRTDFRGFEFNDHHSYLERNNWELHGFVEPDGVHIDFAVPMTNETIEQTYLTARDNAQDIGDKRAAFEFEIKRNRYNRSKNKELANDETEDLDTVGRMKKWISVGENYFMDWTCGYGNRLSRITMLMLVTPLVFALFYAVGGPFETGAQSMMEGNGFFQAYFESAYYSYITFSSVGYGDIGPQAPLAKVLASAEGIIGGLFIALFIYTLSKRIDY